MNTVQETAKQSLQEGQQVVTVGAYGLPDNAKVHVESPDDNSGKEPPKQD